MSISALNLSAVPCGEPATPQDILAVCSENEMIRANTVLDTAQVIDGEAGWDRSAIFQLPGEPVRVDSSTPKVEVAVATVAFAKPEPARSCSPDESPEPFAGINRRSSNHTLSGSISRNAS